MKKSLLLLTSVGVLTSAFAATAPAAATLQTPSFDMTNIYAIVGVLLVALASIWGLNKVILFIRKG